MEKEQARKKSTEEPKQREKQKNFWRHNLQIQLELES